MTKATRELMIDIFEADDGAHTFLAISLTRVPALLGLSRTNTLRLLEKEGILNDVVSRVPGTPRRKGTHRAVPVSRLTELCPELRNITQPGKLKIKK
jgi:hypothetical protein